MKRIDLYNVLIAPVITEKSNTVAEKREQVVFKVLKSATKADVKNGGNEKEVDITNTYDPHGVITQKQTIFTGTGGITKSISYGFDANFRYPTSFTNANSQVSTTTYDPRWGKALSTTGIDNLTSTFTYDVYGRNTSMLNPDGLSTSMEYDWVTQADVSTWTTDPFSVANTVGSPPIPNGALYKITTTSKGKPGVTNFYDLCNRPVKMLTDGFENPLTAITAYDIFGNVYQQSNTYDVTGSSAVKPVINTYNYDMLNRLLSTTEQAPSDQNTINAANYAYVYSSGTTSVTMTSNGKTLVKVYDATNLLTSSADDMATLTYTYSPNHLPTTINLGSGTTITSFTYDAYARKTAMRESNSGLTTYDYSGLGLLNSKTDNNNKTYTCTYDLLGRIATMSSNSGDAYTYNYVPSGNGVNQLQNQKITGSSNTIEYDYTYDALNRLTQVSENLGTAGIFSTGFTYDAYNNVTKLSYPSSNFAINRIYDQHGYLKQITRADNNNSIWQANSMNPLGDYDSYNLGINNTINVAKTYSNFGYLSKILAGAGANQVQNLSLSFNQLTGNLSSRSDAINGQSEAFSYDLADRLKTYGQNGSTNYFANGNIQQKGDVGTYSYSSSLLNAVVQIDNSSGIVSATEQDITFNAFNKAQTIIEGTNQADIIYGPDQQRTEMDLSVPQGGITGKNYYLPNMDMQVVGTNTTQIHYINAGDGLCALYVWQNGTGNFTTHPPIANPAWLMRGYTEHEHLPQFSLINMNGRFYDPKLARVLSPDDHVDDGANPQAYNRYSYCINNPLKYTDPSGEDFGLDDIFVLTAGFITGDLDYSFAHNVKVTDKKALAAGGIGAVEAEVGYLTLGGGMLSVGDESSYVGNDHMIVTNSDIWSAAGSYAGNYAANATANVISNQSQLSALTGWNGVLLQAGYGLGAAFQTGFTSDFAENFIDENIGYKTGFYMDVEDGKVFKGISTDFVGGLLNGGISKTLGYYSTDPKTRDHWKGLNFGAVAGQTVFGGLAQGTQKLVGNFYDIGFDGHKVLGQTFIFAKDYATNVAGSIVSALGNNANAVSVIPTSQFRAGFAGSASTDLYKMLLDLSN